MDADTQVKKETRSQEASPYFRTTRGAYLVELFSSVQGEGLYVGERQIFIRFYGCHLNCHFCDTPETVIARQPKWFYPSTFQLEQTPGCRDFKRMPNPVSAEQLLRLVLDLDLPRGLHHSVSLTGGEPLLHLPFLHRFLPIVKAEGLRVYLETAGDLPRALQGVLEWVDIVAMDIKLPSVTKDRPHWTQHQTFLRLCVEAEREIFVKVVVSAEADPAEIEQAACLIAKTAPSIPLILQPMNPFGEAQNPPTPAQLLEWQQLARRFLPHVRVIPQCHKIMGQL